LFHISNTDGSNSIDSFGVVERFVLVQSEAQPLDLISQIDSRIQEECISVPKLFKVKSGYFEPKIAGGEIKKLPIELSRRYLEFNSDMDIRAVKVDDKSLLCVSFSMKGIFKQGDFIIIDTGMPTSFNNEPAESTLDQCFNTLKDLAYFNVGNSIEVNFESLINAIGDKAMIGLVLNRDRTHMLVYQQSEKTS
jgi:hypothetical protein